MQAYLRWLDKFKSPHGVVHKGLKCAAASDEDCVKWKKEVIVLLILNDYQPQDIFNVAETALFYKALPEKTLTFKDDKCHGGNHSKERVTVMVSANMAGTEKLKLLVIGQTKDPRCFSGIKSLPVHYESNNLSLMTSTAYETWLRSLDRKFTLEQRKVVLFVDNCPAHPKILIPELQSIQVVFFPPNMTSKLQPMGQGIIKKSETHL